MSSFARASNGSTMRRVVIISSASFISFSCPCIATCVLVRGHGCREMIFRGSYKATTPLHRRRRCSATIPVSYASAQSRLPVLANATIHRVANSDCPLNYSRLTRLRFLACFCGFPPVHIPVPERNDNSISGKLLGALGDEGDSA